MTTNDNNDSKQVSEFTYRELTEEQLNLRCQHRYVTCFTDPAALAFRPCGSPAGPRTQHYRGGSAGFCELFIAHSLVQLSLNITIPSSLTSLLKQARPAGL